MCIINYVDFWGLKLSVFNNPRVLQYIKDIIQKRNKIICFGYSLGTFPYLKKHPEIAVYGNTFDIMLSDGRGLFLLSKMLGYKLKSDISIPNFSLELLKLANDEKYSVLIIGSSPENNLNATLNARKLFPNAILFDGISGGSFSISDNQKTIAYINGLKPNILLIGVSSPKKEKFAYEWKGKLKVNIIVPFGGAIDILSGKSKPIPKFIKKIALGAIWRFLQEPKRLFRDSILYPLNVIFLLIPSLLFNVYILKRPFSIPKFYNRESEAFIK